jgi:predicted nucleic acid-binding protein
MSAKFFLDTNILVYTFDRQSKVKNKKAIGLVGEALEERTGVISYQVVQEFVNVATKKFSVPMQGEDLDLYLKAVLLPLCEVHSSGALFQRALDIRQESGFSFYDSLIVAGAAEAECRILYSEDLQHGRTVGGVKIVNPF